MSTMLWSRWMNLIESYEREKLSGEQDAIRKIEKFITPRLKSSCIVLIDDQLNLSTRFQITSKVSYQRFNLFSAKMNCNLMNFLSFWSFFVCKIVKSSLLSEKFRLEFCQFYKRWKNISNIFETKIYFSNDFRKFH